MNLRRSKHKINIMESIDVLDRVTITIFQPQPGHFSVDVLAKEEGKQAVFDLDARAILEQKLHEKTQNIKADHPNVRGYLEEFTGRYIQELHKRDLFIIEDIPEAIEDHYSKIRREFSKYHD